MFYLYNLPRETEWQCTLNKRCMEQLDRAQTIPIQNVWVAQQILSKIVLTIECGDGETIFMFHL